MKLVSACLLGVKCRYDGKSKPNKKIISIFRRGQLIPICPEQLGGLTTPRVPAELTGDGAEVLDGKAKVFKRTGEDVTKNFIKGAKETIKLARLLDIKGAILKQKCPSCACGKLFDGTFSEKIIEADGVTTALLKRNGIKVVTEEAFNI